MDLKDLVPSNQGGCLDADIILYLSSSSSVPVDFGSS